MKRDLLLDAAEQLLAEHGTTALTLAAVAARAGVSKGGLLYHFGTKEALVNALVERLIAEFDQAVEARLSAEGGGYTRAYVETTFEIVTDRDPARARRRWAVVAAAATASDLAEPLRAATRRWHRADAAADDPVTARIVRLAVDGLWEAMEYDPELFDADECDELRRRLLALLDGPEAPRRRLRAVPRDGIPLNAQS
ncbi:TetR/AcrR family transcriptional regulator [Yinghuangia seranimata]|uniref:TetR/AcrR family transcriptional regulator n=1 Tax=Yinghuangia seranimata TaxID=408067 RepID=UPI00248B7D41|nr:TetR/AcrR family transcriptional regulator [Yinghuangia seranimata]MDI2126469.1 TetR/AcrR family transcriptional regulator [Yinghuangia seranimata]